MSLNLEFNIFISIISPSYKIKFFLMPFLVMNSIIAIHYYATIRINAMSLDNNHY